MDGAHTALQPHVDQCSTRSKPRARRSHLGGRPAAGRAELPATLELTSTRRAMHQREILPAVRAEADVATARQGTLAVRAVLPAIRDPERPWRATRRIARGGLVRSGCGRLRCPWRRPTRGDGSAGLRSHRARRLRRPPRAGRSLTTRSAIQLLQCLWRQRDVRRREVANARRVRARRLALGAEDVAHLPVDDEVPLPLDTAGG